MTREEAKQAISDYYCHTDLRDEYGDYCDQTEYEKAFDMAIKALEQEPKWIPVSERLPDEREKCLVAFKGGYVGIMCYASDLYRVDEYDFCDEKGKAGWFDYDRELGHYSRDDVIAWMPLPTPYKAESEDKE
jgi:hypothetical protein